MPPSQFDVRGQDYSRIILPLARQEKSVLHDRVFIKTDIVGKCFYQDQIGKWKMQPKTSVNQDTPQNDPNFQRTRIDIGTHNDARMFDRTLEMQQFSDPTSVAGVSLQSAVGIQIDEIIYNALGGKAYRGEKGDKVVDFPESQIIKADFEKSGVNSGLTTAKIRRAAQMMTAKGVPNSDRTLVTSATGLEQMLGTTSVTSSDYNTVKALVNGELNTWLGFHFVILTDDVIKRTGKITDNFAFHKTGICFGMLEELFLRIEERSDKSYSKQVYYEISAGAGRLEEDKVVLIKSDDSVVVNNT